MIIYHVGVHRNQAHEVLKLGIPICTLSSYEWFHERVRERVDEGFRLLTEGRMNDESDYITERGNGLDDSGC